MKTTKLKLAAAFFLLLSINSTFAQKNRDRDRDDREYRDENYDYNRSDRNRDRNDRNDYDRDDNDRIRDYQNGRNDYRRNPYDYRNLPRDWDRQRSRDFDWYSYDYNNRYDPRCRGDFDGYFPWDPNNPYDIRNNRNFYGNNQYWRGGRPNRIIIVPPSFRFGNPGWAKRNHSRHYGRRW